MHWHGILHIWEKTEARNAAYLWRLHVRKSVYRDESVDIDSDEYRRYRAAEIHRHLNDKSHRRPAFYFFASL